MLKMPEGTEEEKIAKKVAGQHLAEMESEADNDPFGYHSSDWWTLYVR